MRNKLSTTARIIVVISTLLLITTYLWPVWSIYLVAPQYPEGLEMNIWLYQLTGEVEILNGLNHYIGMKKISQEMFPEFDFLIYIIGFFIALGLGVAVSASRKLLTVYCILFFLFGVVALADFYKWEYDYGHNLDPKAAIQIPGLTYQPPLIGHKTLLNFDAYSYPDIGGWMMGLSLLGFCSAWYITRKKKSENKGALQSRKVVAAAASVCIFFASCSYEPEAILYGKDNCSECKMTIMDPKYGGQIVTKKGKVYKFDDAQCMAQFFHKKTIPIDEVHQALLTDYNSRGKNFIKTKAAFVLVSSKLNSPMGSHAAAFLTEADAVKMEKEVGGKISDWATLYNILIK